MNKKEIAVLSLRLLSIYFLFRILDQAANLIYFIAYFNNFDKVNIVNYLMSIVPAILYFIFGIFLWFSSPSLANKIFIKDEADRDFELSLEKIQVVAFSIAGFFLLTSSLPQLSDILVYNFMALSFEGKAPLKSEIILAVIKISLGIWLLLGSKGIIDFVNSLRKE